MTEIIPIELDEITIKRMKQRQYKENFMKKHEHELEEKKRIYRENFERKNEEKLKTKIKCTECGHEYAYPHKSAHYKSKIHKIGYLEKLLQLKNEKT